VFPEVVRLGPDGNLALNYVQLVPVLVRAVQQQQAEITKLENEPTTSVSSLSQGSAGGARVGLPRAWSLHHQAQAEGGAQRDWGPGFALVTLGTRGSVAA